MSCKNQMITPFNKVCLKPKPMIPHLEFFFQQSKAEPIIKVILGYNEKVQEKDKLNEEELKIVNSLKEKISDPKNFFSEEEIQIFLNKLFFWPFPFVVPCIDLFKLLLIHKGFAKILKLNFNEICELFVDLAFRYKNEKNGWKIFNVTSQCLSNSFSLFSFNLVNLSKFDFTPSLDCVLKFVDYSLETKNFNVYNYVSKILLK